jgi:hypothetical protein
MNMIKQLLTILCLSCQRCHLVGTMYSSPTNVQNVIVFLDIINSAVTTDYFCHRNNINTSYPAERKFPLHTSVSSSVDFNPHQNDQG